MFSNGSDKLVPVERPETVATAIRIGSPANWKKTVRAVKESGGTATTVSDSEILAAQKMMARLEGIFAEPAGAAALAGLIKDLRDGDVDRSALVVCVSTGHGLKDPDIATSHCDRPVAIDASVDAVQKFVEG